MLDLPTGTLTAAEGPFFFFLLTDFATGGGFFFFGSSFLSLIVDHLWLFVTFLLNNSFTILTIRI